VGDLPLPKTDEGAILGPITTPNGGNVGCTPSLIDAGSCPDDCSGSSNAGRRHTLPDGLEDRNALGLPTGLGPPDEPNQPSNAETGGDETARS
jgi:hypothetical protein